MKPLLGPAVAVSLLAGLVAPSIAQDRATGLKLDSSKPIQIESNNLEVREAESVAIFTGNAASGDGIAVGELVLLLAAILPL